MAAIMDLVVGVILITAVAIRVFLGANTTGLDPISKNVYNVIPIFLALVLIFLAGRFGGFIGRFLIRYN